MASPLKFFVGGNFKMNPVTIEEKCKLIDTLASAQIPSAESVGALLFSSILSSFD